MLKHRNAKKEVVKRWTETLTYVAKVPHWRGGVAKHPKKRTLKKEELACGHVIDATSLRHADERWCTTCNKSLVATRVS